MKNGAYIGLCATLQLAGTIEMDWALILSYDVIRAGLLSEIGGRIYELRRKFLDIKSTFNIVKPHVHKRKSILVSSQLLMDSFTIE